MVNADFERCTDFLARMIEKYGGELDLPKTEENDMNDTTKQGTQEMCIRDRNICKIKFTHIRYLIH